MDIGLRRKGFCGKGHDGAEVEVAVQDGVVGNLLEGARAPWAPVGGIDGRAGLCARRHHGVDLGDLLVADQGPDGAAPLLGKKRHIQRRWCNDFDRV